MDESGTFSESVVGRLSDGGWLGEVNAAKQ
jgi:hypothetical protein